MRPSDILVDFLTFTLGTGQEESRRDGHRDDRGDPRLSQSRPEVGTTLGLSNISFGLKPAARVVLNSVFLHECQKAGLTSAIVHASKILPMNRIPDEQREVALDLVHDRRARVRPADAFLDLFEGVDAQASAKSRAELLMELPLEERLQRGSSTARRTAWRPTSTPPWPRAEALAIVNDTLLSGMKVVGELFGSGEMQLPFVLQSAEVMKTAVAHLEPHMEKVEGQEGKGKIVLATVKGDVHDIGKNLVDIILSNNGYTVINIGIKQPVSAILDAAQEHDVDVVGMSGLLVKSTVVMKENLLEMNSRGIASTYPVILGGRALTAAYVEQDLDEVYEGEVKYARDAFEGLRLMDELMAVKRGASPRGVRRAAAKDAERRARHARSRAIAQSRAAKEEVVEPVGRSDVATTTASPSRRSGAAVSKGIALADYASWIDERALFLGQWGCAARAAAPARPTRSSSRPRAGRGCGACWRRCRPRGSCRRPSCTATSRRCPRATT
jgi:5-methyltetrahydrofolate--homocysteine methyltransferase